MTPPASLVRAVRAHDPNLRVRFAKASKCWSIEQRMPARHPDLLHRAKPPVYVDTTTSRIAFDRYEAMQDSYFPVFTVPVERGHDVDGILAGIRANDAVAQGSIAKINKALDDAQALLDAEQTKERQTYVKDRAADAADALQWTGGHTIATPMTAQEPVTADVVEQREGFVIRTRKELHRSLA